MKDLFKINWRYTIGEIIIVIIGISIAFALNNWKEGIENEKTKIEYLQNLSTDITTEIKQLGELSNGITGKLTAINKIRPHLGTSIPGRDTMINKLFDIAQTVRFTPENTTFKTLMNSGDLSLIDDFELRHEIQRHYNLHEKILINYERLENINSKYLGDFFIYDMDFDALRKGDFSILDNPLLKNIINSLQGAYYYILQANKDCLASNERLHAQIKDHLEVEN